jgi:hypothetical protein
LKKTAFCCVAVGSKILNLALFSSPPIDLAPDWLGVFARAPISRQLQNVFVTSA